METDVCIALCVCLTTLLCVQLCEYACIQKERITKHGFHVSCYLFLVYCRTQQAKKDTEQLLLLTTVVLWALFSCMMSQTKNLSMLFKTGEFRQRLISFVSRKLLLFVKCLVDFYEKSCVLPKTFCTKITQFTEKSCKSVLPEIVYTEIMQFTEKSCEYICYQR